MLQMERLGTFFPINGPKAARVPDLLQRCNSVRLDRLSLAIRWRKGDSASLMSESAGGQAVSLLCACIFSLFNDEDSSTILSYLCIRLLPLGTVCASMSQLHRVGTILSSKLHALGFGTLLAEQVMRVCNVYKQLEMAVTSDLLTSFSLDAAVDVLHALSRAVREPGVLVRIEGTSGMGYIIAIAMTMFVEDCLITVQGMILNSGTRQSILIELGGAASQQGSCQISIEEVSDDISSHSLLIRLVSIAALLRRYSPSPHPCSGCSVTFLLSPLVTNHSLLTIRFCRIKVINPTRVYFRVQSRLPGSPNRTPRNTSFDLFSQVFSHMT